MARRLPKMHTVEGVVKGCETKIRFNESGDYPIVGGKVEHWHNAFTTYCGQVAAQGTVTRLCPECRAKLPSCP